MNMTSQTWNLAERPCDPFRSTEPENFKMRNEVRKLLEVSTRSVNSDSPLVSPEGLGCSGSSLESMRKPVGQTSEKTLYCSSTSVMDSAFAKRLALTQPSAAGHLGSCLKPEDDILYQWRLRRKLEQSGNNVQSGLQRSAPLDSHSSLLQQAQKKLITRDLSNAGSETHAQESPFPLTFPHPTVSQVPPKHHTSPQTSHFRSVLPCPPQSSAQVSPTESRLQEWRNSSGPCICSQSSAEQQTKNTSQNQLRKVHSFPDEHLSKNKEEHRVIPQKSGKGRKSAPPQQEGAAAEEMSKRRNGTSSSRTKSSRHARHGNHTAQPDPALRQVDREGKRQKQQMDSRNERLQKTLALPRSPLHATLGMVVSEALFPDSGSADSSTSLSITASSEDSHSFLPQTPSPPHSLQRPSEIITKLLQEADNSDESEFEDDPLLLVLREQRRSVKQRICELDMLLEEWKETQPR